MTGFDESLLARTLPEYYKRLFPVHLLCKWLTYGKIKSFFQLQIQIKVNDGVQRSNGGLVCFMRFCGLHSEDIS